MKESLGIILIMLLILCCRDDEQSEQELYNGHATAKVNGVKYDFRPSLKFFPSLGTYSLVLDHFENDVLRTQLHFNPFVDQRGAQNLHRSNNQNLNPQATYSTSIGDGDVEGNNYHLLEMDEVEDFLEIVSLDETTGDVVGNFQASFEVDSLIRFDPSSPDTIVITDGYFETKIKE